MQQLIRFVLSRGFRIAVRYGPVDLSVWLFARIAKTWPSATAHGTAGLRRHLTILALSPEIFRNDLKVFADTGMATICYIPHKWQRGLFQAFYSSGTRTKLIHRPELGETTVSEQRRYHDFLKQFLPRFFSKLGIGLVIGANIKTEPDIDIGWIAKDCGVPYVVLHRENLLASPSIYNAVRDRHKSWGHFKGSHIAVHNDISRQNFIESGYVDAENVSITGCLRMDGFIKMATTTSLQQRQKQDCLSKNRITLFSFITTQGSVQYPFKVFHDTHVAVARFAQRHPNVEVIVKPKAEHIEKSGWSEAWDRAMADAKIVTDEIKNLKILPNADPHELILSSRYVLGINSTTVLEAGIVDIPVIIPVYKYIREGEYLERTRFVDYLDLFEVPDDQESLVEIMERMYKDPNVSHETLCRRRALFEKYVSSLDGNSLSQNLNLFNDLIHVANGFRNVAAQSPEVMSSTLINQQTHTQE